jgi:hypothetical protein
VLAWLALYLLVVLAVLLSPIALGVIPNAVGDWLRGDLGITFFGSGWIEFAANIAMFAPLGFLLTLAFRHPWFGAGLALALSVGAELAQLIIPSREASLRDVIANTLGAAVGAALAWLFVLRREHRVGASADRSEAH